MAKHRLQERPTITFDWDEHRKRWVMTGTVPGESLTKRVWVKHVRTTAALDGVGMVFLMARLTEEMEAWLA